MCEYIEFNMDEQGGLNFVCRDRLDECEVEEILEFADEKTDVSDVNFIERINMTNKIKFFFKCGQAESDIIEKDVRW